MELIKDFIDLFLHLDQHLSELIGQYGAWTYAILWLIVFCETGLVVTPFLPGDSLLFAAGTFAGMGDLDPWLLFVLLGSAAVLGDTVNYWIGKRIGPRAFTGTVPFLNQAHLRKTEAFYEKHGGKTIIIARFVPIVRTFAPFVAGVGSMHYGRFLAYNVFGGVLWVGLFVFGGYLFGNIPVVRANFSLVVVAIILISVMPIVLEWIKARRAGAA
jgi:membrane-associated protein